jgi:putative urate catabolism protein
MSLPIDDRDYIGHGETPPDPRWPGGARIAVQFVLNYEEGGERNILNGDPASEVFLSEIIGAREFVGARHMSMESIYEYGARAGVWRLLRLFRQYGVPLTVFAVALALKKNPALVEAFLRDGHEIASHGWRWIDYHGVDEATEREHMALAVTTLSELTGERPLGWYTGRSSENTLRLVAEDGGFLYCADDYSDDLPFWARVAGRRQLIVPYTLDANDMRFATAQGFNSGEQFYGYLKDSFDMLYAEGATTPKMLSIGLHCRLAGRPGRAAALERFLRHVRAHQDVWLCRRIDIARHWHAEHVGPAA